MKSNVAKLTIILAALFICMVQTAKGFYDPGLQRWVNRDPSGEDGGINLYGFVRGDSINGIDSYGECGFVIPFVVGAAEAIGGFFAANATAAAVSTTLGVAGGLLAGGLLTAPSGAAYPINYLPNSIANAPPAISISVPFPIDVSMGQGERNWERGRGDDPFWDLSVEDLKNIEKNPNSTPREKERARKIRKQKQKDCS